MVRGLHSPPFLIQAPRKFYLPGLWRKRTWREDNRRVSNGDQVHRVTALAVSRKPSVPFSGYWQRHTSARPELKTLDL
jgi:hypothetical protein